MKKPGLKTDLVLATTTDVGRKLLGYVVLRMTLNNRAKAI